MNAVVEVSEQDVLASRMYSHHLSIRLEAFRALDAFGACGLRSPSMGSSDVSATARTEWSNLPDRGFLQNDLMTSISIRGAIRVFPVQDFLVFTRALVPEGEHEVLHLLGGCAPPLLRVLGIDSRILLDTVAGVAREVLAQVQLDKKALGTALAHAVGQDLPDSKRELWLWPSEVVPGQTVGETLCRCCIPSLAFLGIVCVVFRAGERSSAYALTDRIFPSARGFGAFGIANTSTDPALWASSELVRRYLRCFGPATSEDFATWAGIALSHAQRLWSPVAGELQEVVCEGRLGWMLYDDAVQIHTYPFPEGVRLLAWHDPFLQQAERSLVVQGKSLRSYFYRSTPGGPGMVLFDGRCAGGWRMAVEHGKLNITFEDIGQGLSRIADVELEQEVRHLAASLGLGYTGYSIVCL